MKRLPCSLISSMAVLALFACGGGGGGTSGGGTPVTPPQTVAVTEKVLPLELKVMQIDLENVSGVVQAGGPAVSSLSYANGTLKFLAPADTGRKETLNFQFSKADGTHSHYLFELLTLVTPTIENGYEDYEGPTANEWSDLVLSAPSLVNLDILPANYSEFRLVFHSASGSKISTIRIYLHNGSNLYDITSYFSIDANTGIVLLKSGSMADFQAKLSDKTMDLSVSGYDDSGDSFMYSVYFYYGSNTINGTVVDGSGSTVTALTGKTVVLSGFNSGIRLSASILANGTFTINNVPTDSYSLTLADTSFGHFGSTLFLIESGGSIVDVDLITIETGTSGARQPSPAVMMSGSPSTIIGNKTVGEFQKNKPIEPRSQHLPQAPKPLSAIIETANSITVTGSNKDNVVFRSKIIQVPQFTQEVKFNATVSTAEYPTYTTQGSKFNDTWEFWAYCGTEEMTQSIFHEQGSVNHTHADNGTHSYEKSLDTSQLTNSGPLNCRIAAQTVNIGDGLLPTTVKISLDNASGITINRVQHVDGLFKDDNGNQWYNISISQGDGYGIAEMWEWLVEVKYTPKDAEITHMELRLSYNAQSWTISDDLFFMPVGNENGTLQALIDRIDLPVTPHGLQKASLLVTLKGHLKGKSTILTSNTKPVEFPDSPAKTAFMPLFEIRDVATVPDTRRYVASDSPRNDDVGGDGWGRADMLDWLTTGLGGTLGLKFNDISGQNAWQKWVIDKHGNGQMKSLGVHQTHKGGYDADARYWDENGGFATAFNGTGGGAAIENAVTSAIAEVAAGDSSGYTQLKKLIGWIKANRTGLASVASDANVKVVYVGAQPWFVSALLFGSLDTGSSLIPIPDVTSAKVDGAYPLLGTWNMTGLSIEIVPAHESHFHVRFKPKKE